MKRGEDARAGVEKLNADQKKTNFLKAKTYKSVFKPGGPKGRGLSLVSAASIGQEYFLFHYGGI